MSDPRNPGGPDHPFGRPRHSGPPQGPRHGGPAGRNGGSNGGHPPHGVPTRPIPFPVGGRTGEPRGEAEDAFAEEPLDLVAVQADDELINALAAGMTVSAPGYGGYDADDKVVAMLAAWKAEVDAEPIPELVDVDTAVAAVESGTTSRSSSRRRHLVPLAGAAALLVFSIAGVSIGAQSAEPGDALFGVTQVLYKDAANSRVAAVEVKQRIQQVNDKLQRGDTAGAQQELVAIPPLLEQVRPEEGKTYLAAEQTFLAAKVQETPAGQPTDPQAPLKDGTPRPQVPATEGSADPTAPASSSSSPTSTGTPPAPATGVPGTGTGTTSPDPKSADVPPTGGSTAPSAPPSSTATPKPTTEGGQDPATPTSTATPPGTTTTSMGSGEPSTAVSPTTPS